MTSLDFPKITFGIIVFNGEPFTKYCLRSLYPFAHEIIVVEGACKSSASLATTDGHSTDSTLQTLFDFQEREDPDKKLRIVSRDGFWPEKDEQSQAYAQLATGNYLWQVDIDEFYRSEDMVALLGMLKKDPEIAGVSFKQISFWGGFDYTSDGWFFWRVLPQIHRIFRWRQGYRYVNHRPPTVVSDQGKDLRELKWISGKTMAQAGIYMYHYCLLFPKQVMDKSTYYEKVEWDSRHRAVQWAQEVFMQLKKPYRVHNVYDFPSWLERFRGAHPEQIEVMRADLQSGRLEIPMRQTADIERLLRSPFYATGRTFLKIAEPVVWNLRSFWRRSITALKDPPAAVQRLARKVHGASRARKSV
ncbi:MAG TPA: glycosyltransferase family A protein [Acidobacteriota bacterium]|nr:glycosyltransferase family A protein [Acidobacteriota bacterium]